MSGHDSKTENGKVGGLHEHHHHQLMRAMTVSGISTKQQAELLNAMNKQSLSATAPARVAEPEVEIVTETLIDKMVHHPEIVRESVEAEQQVPKRGMLRSVTRASSKRLRRLTDLNQRMNLMKKEEENSEGDHWERFSKQQGQTSYGARTVGGLRPDDFGAYSSMESIDYTVPDTVEEAMMARIMSRNTATFCCKGCDPFARWLGLTRNAKRRAFLWIVYFNIGGGVALTITFILRTCDVILEMRVKNTVEALDDNDMVRAWLTWTGSSLICCLFACACVLIAPSAASSGIPGLLAFLNGVKPRGGRSPVTGKLTSFTSVQTLACKIVGMIASIPSGMCIGPEGPIIHIAALMAHWVAKALHFVENHMFPDYKFTERHAEARDFMATGAACGITTAFRAPLAGVLFVVEEASSHITTAHIEFTFLACLTSYITVWMVEDTDGGTLVKFAQTTGDFCVYHDPFDIWCFLFIGLVGGCFGAFFNQIVEHLNHLRVHHINPSAWKRTLEVVVVCLLSSSVCVGLPTFFDCMDESRQVMFEDSAGCLNEADQYQLMSGEVNYQYLSAIIEEVDRILPQNATECSSRLRRQLGTELHPRVLADPCPELHRRMLAGDSSASSCDPCESVHRRVLAGETVDPCADVHRRWLAATDDTSACACPCAELHRRILAGDATADPAECQERERRLAAATTEGPQPPPWGDCPTSFIEEVRAALADHRVPNKKILGPEDDVLWLDNHGKYIHLHYSHRYNCGADSHKYNGMAMMWLNGGVKAVKVLMQRGFPHMLSWQVLMSFCSAYFVLAAITAGISIPAGLMVPMLLIGGSYGRLFGLAAVDIKKDYCKMYVSPTTDGRSLDDVSYWSTTVRWMLRDCRIPDPAVYAIVGMASFLGGSGRITIMLATVLLELTDDAQMIAPVGMVCVLAMLVGNFFNHGLYHGLIPVFNIPYLNPDPPGEAALAQVNDVMCSKLIVVPKLVTTRQLRGLLKLCHEGQKQQIHNTGGHGHGGHGHGHGHGKKSGKVAPGPESPGKAHGKGDHGEKPHQPVKKMNRSNDVKKKRSAHNMPLATEPITHNAFPVVVSMNDHTLAGLVTIKQLELALHAAQANRDVFVHVTKYADRSPLTVFSHTKLNRAYEIFRKLGMRHLVVVNSVSSAVGMITRKDLMGYLLQDQRRQELILIIKIQARARAHISRRRLEAKRVVKKFASHEAGVHLELGEVAKAIEHLMHTRYQVTMTDEHMTAAMELLQAEGRTKGLDRYSAMDLGEAVYRVRATLHAPKQSITRKHTTSISGSIQHGFSDLSSAGKNFGSFLGAGAGTVANVGTKTLKSVQKGSIRPTDLHKGAKGLGAGLMKGMQGLGGAIQNTVQKTGQLIDKTGKFIEGEEKTEVSFGDDASWEDQVTPRSDSETPR